MAVHAPITGAPSRASEIHRRHLLSGLGVASLFAASGTARANPGAVANEGSAMNMYATIPFPAQIRPEERLWNQRLAAYESAHAAMERYDTQFYAPAMKRFNGILGPRPKMRVVWNDRDGREHSEDVHPFHQYPRGLFYDQHRACQAANQDYRSRWSALSDESWWTEVQTTMDNLDRVEGEARDALMECPSPHMAALAYKLRLALANEEMWACDREALDAESKRVCDV